MRTSTGNRTPADLASTVCGVMNRRKLVAPPEQVVVHLFEALYYTSLKTEEGQPVRCYVVYLDPKNPDPKPPKRITQDRWSYIPFDKPIPLTADNLAKIAEASDPRSSSFAVYADADLRLFIWGIVDQGNSYYDFANRESDRGAARPGVFQASITGVGRVVAYMGYEIIAELNVNRIVSGSMDVMHYGPVRDKLQQAVDAHVAAVRASVGGEGFSSRDYWGDYGEDMWFGALCRLIKRIQGYRHGGTLLVTDEKAPDNLNVKYGISYSRLRTALLSLATFETIHDLADNNIYEAFERRETSISRELWLKSRVSGNDIDEAKNELDGCLWFISLLTRVDGLVLLTPNLDVLGFGVEITVSDPPLKLFAASGPYATERQMKKLEYERYGTRHRSIMRYCATDSSAIGIVVSQDGHVRVVTQVADRVVLWESVRLDRFKYSTPDGMRIR